MANNSVFNPKGTVVTINGTSGNNTIIGTIKDEIINGLAGNDYLNATSGGRDSVYGGLGNDTLFGAASTAQYLDGGDGNDYIAGGVLAANTLIGGAGNDTLTGCGNFNGGEGSDIYKLTLTTNINNVVNNQHSNTGDVDVLDISGAWGGNIIFTRSGNDLVFKFNGRQSTNTISNWFLGSQYQIDQIKFMDGTISAADINNGFKTASNVVMGGSTSDVMMTMNATYNCYYDGGAGNDVIAAGYGTDVVNGGAGNDAIYGMGGNDSLNGGLGNDTLYGGLGADIYKFDGTNWGADIIKFDSTNATDSIVFGGVNSVTANKVGNNVVLTGSTGNTVTIENWNSSKLQNITFSNGTTTTIDKLLNATTTVVPNTTLKPSYDLGLVIGIGDYKGTSYDLSGVKYDVMDTSGFLSNEKATGVRTLTDGSATKTNILSYFDQLATNAKAGDEVFVFYSGHGYSNGIVSAELGTISNDVLYEKLNAIGSKVGSTGHVTFVEDACYSGGLVNYFKSHTTDQRYTIFASSSSTEVSYDVGSNGIFSRYLYDNGITNKLADTNKDGLFTTGELFNYVGTQIASYQHPQIYGSTTNVFG